MLINFSNHPSAQWDEKQIGDAMACWGGVQDVPFPAVDPLLDVHGVEQLALVWAAYLHNLIESLVQGNHAVHIMGEHTLCFVVVAGLRARNIVCVASTTARQTTEPEPGKKLSLFHFGRFREYYSTDEN